MTQVICVTWKLHVIMNKWMVRTALTASNEEQTDYGLIENGPWRAADKQLCWRHNNFKSSYKVTLQLHRYNNK